MIHHPYRGYPKTMEDSKYIARGQTADGHYIQAKHHRVKRSRLVALALEGKLRGTAA